MTSRKKVLVVEDSPDLRRLYALGLNQRGYEVKLAANGAEALDRIRTEKPDVILLDLVMPIMSGWEVLERMQQDGNDCIPVVLVTGHAAESGHPTPDCVISFLEKPVSLGQLGDSIDHALAKGKGLRTVKTVEK